MQSPLRILVVEDDDFIAEMVREALSEGGFDTEAVASGQEAFALIDDDRKYRALVTDINLQDELTGWQVAKRARELFAGLPWFT